MAERKIYQPLWNSQGAKYQKAVCEHERLKSHLQLQAQFQCCAKNPDTIFSPAIILPWGLVVTNCPIYQKKTVLCNLASLVLCIHQYLRNKKSTTESKPGRQRDLELTGGWSSGAVQWHAGDQGLAFVLLPGQKGITDSASRSSWPCCTDKSPLTLADLRVAQTWHWWLSPCSHLYHPKHNGFTMRYWELWTVVPHHPAYF